MPYDAANNRKKAKKNNPKDIEYRKRENVS